MNQKAFILVFLGIVMTAAAILYSYNNSNSEKALKSQGIEQAGIKTSAPVEVIIWESMSQVILGSGSIN
jgi:hypothetical protein